MIEYTSATFYRLIPLIEGNQIEGKAETLACCQAEMMRFAAFLRKLHEMRIEAIPSLRASS